MSPKEEFLVLLNEMDRYFKILQFGLFSNRKRSILLNFFSNWSIIFCIFSSIFLSCLITVQSVTFNAKVQQLFTAVCCVQAVVRGFNQLWRIRELNALLQWFKSLYDPVENPEYQRIIDHHLCNQNKWIRMILR